MAEKLLTVAAYANKAGEIDKKNEAFRHPLAITNLARQGFNPHQHLTEGSRLAPLRDATNTPVNLSNAEKIEDPYTNQKFNVIKGNWEEFSPDKPVTVYFSLYGNQIEQGESHYRVEELARQMPERALLAIDHPNMGGSDPIRKDQRSTRKKNSHFAIADAELRVMQQLGIKKINLVGQSMGAYTALAVSVRAAEFGITVENLLLYEIPTNTVSVLLALREMSELGNLDLYHSHPFDPQLFTASGLDTEIKVGKRELIRDVWKQDPWFVYGRSMAKNTIEDRVRQVLSSQPHVRIGFINGSESKVSRQKKILSMVQHVKEDYEDRMWQNIFPGEGHLVMVHPQRFATNVKLGLLPPQQEH